MFCVIPSKCLQTSAHGAELQVTWLLCLLQEVCNPSRVLPTLSLSCSGPLPSPPDSQTPLSCGVSSPLMLRERSQDVCLGSQGPGLKVFTVPRLFCDPS